ncbi:MAG: hypothetical protein MUE44_35390 [Oscillatoriaceae cyanobacterium Prado104]|jgi:hypothetical protein|nr:hypothetical protein [Oscillatoriaceae cyanobacterium Prado104]
MPSTAVQVRGYFPKTLSGAGKMAARQEFEEISLVSCTVRFGSLGAGSLGSAVETQELANPLRSKPDTRSSVRFSKNRSNTT